MAEHGRACPYDQANVLSKLTFWWMNALFRLGYKDELTEDNICDTSVEDGSSKLESLLKRYWKEEVQKHSEEGKPSLFRAVLKAFKWQWIPPGLMALAFESIKVVQPFLIGQLVSYFNKEKDAVSTSTAYGLGAGLGLSAILLAILNPMYFFIMQHIALRMKIAVGALIYRKVLSLSTEAFHYTSAGQIVNHLSTDVEKFNEAIDLLHFFWTSPISVVAVIFLLYQQLGVTCFWGFLVIFAIVPLQAGLSALFGKLRQRIGALSDQRIQLMSEILLAMRVIKMQCWERPFQELINKLRSKEIQAIRVGAFIRAFNNGMEQVAVNLMLATMLVATWASGEQFPASSAFVVFGLCQALRITAFFFMSFSIEKTVQLQASLLRVQDCTHCRSELGIVRKLKVIEGLGKSLEEVTVRLALMAIVLSLGRQSTSATDIFTTLAWFLALHSIVLRFPTQAIQSLKIFYSTASVVQTFLLLDEEKETIRDLRLHRSIQQCCEPHADWAVDIDHMTARWPLVYTEGRRRFQKKRQRSSTSSTKSLLRESDMDQAFSLKYISLEIKKGELIAVVGVVGSGKSSLLMSLIGELPYEIGKISINGKASYCSQTNWVFSGTVRDNILFGQSYVPHRYKAVVEACGLARDLDLLPKGDLTFVGERGLQLSGGQKARLTLARCIYFDGDVILLDDPLSAVDANVGRHIFQRCILDLLAEKTVILVTHQLQYLKQVDRIVVLRDGCIHDIGTYDELKSRGTDMKVLTSTEEHPGHATEAALEAEEEQEELMLQNKSLEKQASENAASEEVLSGAIGLRVYWKYFSAGYGIAFLPVLIPLWVAGPAFFCYSDWMLAKWVGQQSNSTDSSSSTRDWAHMPHSLRWYIIALLASIACILLFSLLYLQVTIVAGKRLHDKMLAAVVHAVSRFFDTHPVGQILNRFSRDLNFIDDLVSIISFFVAFKTTHFLGFFIVTVIVNPWLTIAIVPLLLLIVFIRIYALQTLRQVKRLEAKARSPVYSHVSDTILGLETIRALGQQNAFLSQFDALQDKHTSALFLYLSSYRWMSLRSLAVVNFYLNIIIFLSLGLKDSLDGNLLALSLIYCIAMGEPFEFYMRVSADLETYMTSVERVLGYCSLEQEPALHSDKPPPPDWPSRGAITFTKTSLQYSHNAPLVLKNIDCHIQGKEKIGVVGRTGSGKSSLITSLFRLVQPTGHIYIDTVDVSKLGLYDLRSKISVIPQEPTLFGQTLRWNLDPLEEFSDERLWNALDQVQLKEKINQMPGKLYTEITEGGANLSVGQRQLICLARAILKYSRILILDEATANVDQETDDIIQRTIRAKFRESTVLTIAHRLYTIMDCDRIMVLADGELKEFDSPYNLLQDSEGIFTRLVLSSGKNQAKQLQALAEMSQHKRTSAHIQLQRAMLLAHEQLVQSTEDLSMGQAALNWNRFTHSLDSLDKAEVENIVQKEKKTVAPSQKIIHRKSPKRNNRRIIKEEEEELLTYNSAPKARNQFRGSTERNNSDKIRGQLVKSPSDSREEDSAISLPYGNKSGSDSERSGSPSMQNFQHLQNSPHHDKRSVLVKADVVETDIDFPPLDTTQASQREPEKSQKAMRPEKPSHSSSKNYSESRSTISSRSRPKASYVPPPHRDDFKEQFV
ncbi:multidrug resistance-associated protein 4 [Plakobranchus ocellatus]|uniref:Multidrug resistance-associated protein 4 n=1 Tax=Plakobranchus ocellatus TaxID=259542 RepID=A0AAV4DCN4_9GAST|nr:multidrug resistance-associated protein 4 [Plakobranchus ocellatus]